MWTKIGIDYVCGLCYTGMWTEEGRYVDYKAYSIMYVDYIVKKKVGNTPYFYSSSSKLVE